MSRATSYICASLVAAFSATAFSVDARAYSETPPAPPPQEQQQAAPAVPQPPPDLPGVIVQAPPAGAELNLTPGGKEIVIPGIGEIGHLPKLDFGLELLYGSSTPQTQKDEPGEQGKDNDVMIKGTLKHRF